MKIGTMLLFVMGSLVIGSYLWDVRNNFGAWKEEASSEIYDSRVEQISLLPDLISTEAFPNLANSEFLMSVDSEIAMFSSSPSDISFVFGGSEVLRIHSNGNVEYKGSLDEASKVFWLVVQEQFPEICPCAKIVQ